MIEYRRVSHERRRSPHTMRARYRQIICVEIAPEKIISVMTVKQQRNECTCARGSGRECEREAVDEGETHEFYQYRERVSHWNEPASLIMLRATPRACRHTTRWARFFSLVDNEASMEDSPSKVSRRNTKRG